MYLTSWWVRMRVIEGGSHVTKRVMEGGNPSLWRERVTEGGNHTLWRDRAWVRDSAEQTLRSNRVRFELGEGLSLMHLSVTGYRNRVLSRSTMWHSRVYSCY